MISVNYSSMNLGKKLLEKNTDDICDLRERFLKQNTESPTTKKKIDTFDKIQIISVYQKRWNDKP